MANLPSYRVQTLSGVLNSSTFTAIPVVGNWNYLCVSNKNSSVGISLRTDADDDTTEVTINAGSEFNVAVPLTPQQQKVLGSRFVSGEPCAYLKAASGVGAGAVIIWA